MKLFMCFGGAAGAVIDDEAAEVAARHLQGQRRRRGHRRSLSFRGKFLPGYKGGNAAKKQSLDQPKKRGVDDADDGVYSVSRASSVASSALLSSATSLDSDASASSSSRSSTASSSPSVSGVLHPPPVNRQAASNTKRPAASSPAAGAVAVVLCLLMVVLCGRVGATLLTSTALYLFPRRWPAMTTTRKEKRGAIDLLECDAASASEAEEEATTAKRKVVALAQGSSARNRNK